MKLRLILALCLCVLAHTASAYTTEVFATNVDAAGTDLRWYVYTPTSGGPTWTAAVFSHGGGYKAGVPYGHIAQTLADAGYICFASEHRLAPPHTEMTNAGPPGDGQQDPPSAGHPTEQTDDVRLAIRTARADPRCNGKVVMVGSSGGGAHGGWWIVKGTNGDDRPDAMVSLSGVYDNDNADLLANPTLLGNVQNYINHLITEGAPFHTAAQAASGYWQTVNGVPTPMLLFNSNHETIPVSVFNNMVTKLNAAGGTVESHLRNGVQHAADYWELGYGGAFPTVRECSLDFLSRMLSSPTPTPTATPGDFRLGRWHIKWRNAPARTPTPTPTATATPRPTGTPVVGVPKYPKGVWARVNYSQLIPPDHHIDPALDADKGIVGLLIGADWTELQPADATHFDWSHMDALLAAATAKGFKSTLWLNLSSYSTPQWLLDLLPSDQKLNLVDPATVDTHRFTYCQYNPTPLYWNRTYMDARKAVMAAAAAKYANNPNVVGYFISFANHHSLDWNIQDEKFDDTHVLDCPCGKPPPKLCGRVYQDQPAMWLAAGWTEQKMLDAGKELCDYAAQVFPKQNFRLPIGGLSDPRMSTPTGNPNDGNYSQLARDIVAYVETRDYNKRFYPMRQIFLCSWKDGTEYLPPASPPNVNSQRYIEYMMAFRARKTGPTPGLSGMQNQWAAEAGPPQCQLLNHNPDCDTVACPAPCVEQLAITKAITYNIDALEITGQDPVSPELYNIIKAGTISMHGVPRP